MLPQEKKQKQKQPSKQKQEQEQPALVTCRRRLLHPFGIPGMALVTVAVVAVVLVEKRGAMVVVLLADCLTAI
jgi:hypothetical protein